MRDKKFWCWLHIQSNGKSTTQTGLYLKPLRFCSDLDHPNQYVVGLALCAVANISSAEIARDAASDVQKLLGSSNPYIRKKVRKKRSFIISSA